MGLQVVQTAIGEPYPDAEPARQGDSVEGALNLQIVVYSEPNPNAEPAHQGDAVEGAADLQDTSAQLVSADVSRRGMVATRRGNDSLGVVGRLPPIPSSGSASLSPLGGT